MPDCAAITGEAVVVDRQRQERGFRRDPSLLGEFPGGCFGELFAVLDCATRNLEFDLGKIRFIENQKTAAPGRVDHDFQRVRRHVHS